MSDNTELTQLYNYNENTQIQTIDHKNNIAIISQRLINSFNYSNMYEELYDEKYANNGISYDSFLERLLLENAKNMLKSTTLFHDEKNDIITDDCKKIINEINVLISKLDALG